MIRIVHVVRPAAGGIRQHVLELLARMDPSEFSVALAAPREFLASLPLGLPLAAQAAVEIAPSFSPGADILAAARLAQFASPRADLLHAHGLRAAFIATLACRVRPLPLLFTAHNLLPPSRLTRLGLRVIASRAAQAIAVSQAVADGLAANGFPADRIVVIPNGVDVEYFAPAPQPPILGEQEEGPLAPNNGGTRREITALSGSPLLGRGGFSFTVGCVARLSPEKGVDTLLRAAALVPDIQFVIAGDGPERAALHKAAPVNVHFAGRIADTRDLYCSVHAVAVPSRQEGQGIVALEALACRVPVVATRVGGLAEMLTDGETALLVPPDQPKELADALRRLRDDPVLREHLAAQGQALVQQRYDVRRMVGDVERVYRKLQPTALS